MNNLSEVNGTIKVKEIKHVLMCMNELPGNDSKNCWVFVAQEILESKVFLFFCSWGWNSVFEVFPFFFFLCFASLHVFGMVCTTFNMHFPSPPLPFYFSSQFCFWNTLTKIFGEHHKVRISRVFIVRFGCKVLYQGGVSGLSCWRGFYTTLWRCWVVSDWVAHGMCLGYSWNEEIYWLLWRKEHHRNPTAECESPGHNISLYRKV